MGGRAAPRSGKLTVGPAGWKSGDRGQVMVRSILTLAPRHRSWLVLSRATKVCACSFIIWILLGAFCSRGFAADSAGPVHGLWVWKTPTVLATPGAAEALRDFCQSQGINEAYVSFSGKGDASEEREVARLIGLLHRSHIRVEALISSTEADEPGKYRDKLLDKVRAVIQFNEHARGGFDGIHLDIEPQQRPENKGAGNLRFLPGLVDAYRAVLAAAEPAHLMVNADIQNKLLKGDLGERRMLLTSLPRFTLMLYELSSPSDGETAAQKAEKLRDASQKFLDMAYDGLNSLNGASVGKMVIGLRTPDYEDLLPAMLKSLDDAYGGNPHYLGWARHSYNDYLKAAR